MDEPISGDDFWRTLLDPEHQTLVWQEWDAYRQRQRKRHQPVTYAGFAKRVGAVIRWAVLGNGFDSPRLMALKRFSDALADIQAERDSDPAHPPGLMIDGKALELPPPLVAPKPTLEASPGASPKPSARKALTAAQDAILRAYYRRPDMPNGQEKQWKHYSKLLEDGALPGGFAFGTFNSFLTNITRLGLSRKAGNPHLGGGRQTENPP